LFKKQNKQQTSGTVHTSCIQTQQLTAATGFNRGGGGTDTH
jgi:hypothetical protein